MRCDGTPCHRPMAHPPLEGPGTVAEDNTRGEGNAANSWGQRRREQGRRAKTTVIGKEKRQIGPSRWRAHRTWPRGDEEVQKSLPSYAWPLLPATTAPEPAQMGTFLPIPRDSAEPESKAWRSYQPSKEANYYLQA